MSKPTNPSARKPFQTCRVCKRALRVVEIAGKLVELDLDDILVHVQGVEPAALVTANRLHAGVCRDYALERARRTEETEEAWAKHKRRNRADGM